MNQEHIWNNIRQALALPQQKQIMASRNPAGWIRSLGSISAWTNRELEWYLAEERLLFACLSDEECDRWVCILNWLINK